MGEKEGGSTVRFTQADLELFSRASGDRNPLHLSEAYSARTAYGEPVVFGVLGCLATLGCIESNSDPIRRLTADFHRPMFRDVDYRLEALQVRDGITVRLLDGSTPLLTTSVQFGPGEARASWAEASEGAVFPRSESNSLYWQQLAVGLEVSGEYRCDPVALEIVRERWLLRAEPSVLGALLWSSYYVGMEIPGRDALFFRLSFDFSAVDQGPGPSHFSTRIISLNHPLHQVKVAVDLTKSNGFSASGQLTAFLRSEIRPAAIEDADESMGENLVGKVAVVLGASRGFGAALVRVLALAGADVIAVSRSEPAWARSQSVWMKRVSWRVGDAGSLEDMGRAARDVIARHGMVDFLVCSAFPSIPSLRLEPEGAERIAAYIEKATNLVLRPFCYFLPLLQASGGCAVVISSIAAEKPVRDWPHYVAAKQAVEGLCKVAPLQYPKLSSLIVRPERMLTEMTNTPMGRHGAQDPSLLARELCEQLKSPPDAGTCRLFVPGLGATENAREPVAQLQHR